MSIEDRIEGAQRRRQEAEARLYRHDGTNLYGDEEHRERAAAIRSEHRAEFDRIDADVAERIGRAGRALLVAENSDLAGGLSTEELQRANTLSGFVADDVERMAPDALAKRCRAALASGDRPALFLLAHHVSRRADGEEDLELAEDLGELAGELRRELDPERERKIEEAREGLEQARALEEMAHYRRRGVSSAGELYSLQTYGYLSRGARGG